MPRALLAGLILTAWLGTLGWNGARQFRGRGATAMELTRQRVGPSAGSFRLERDGVTVGMMLRSVDTLPGEVRITERWDLLLDASRRVTITDVSWLSRDLQLARFETTRGGDVVPLRIEGRLTSPTALVWEAVRAGVPYSDTVESTRPWTVPGALPLLAALATPAVRDSGLTLFEPLSFRSSEIQPRTLRDSVWVVADSAVFDSTTQRFTLATLDTVPATLVSWRADEGRLGLWVDSRGLPVRLSGMFGTTATRTADELVRQDYRPRPRAATGRMP